jgi:hypothetical protein
MDGWEDGLSFEERGMLPPSDEAGESPADAWFEASLGEYAGWLTPLSSEACGVVLICGEVDEDRIGGSGLKIWVGVVLMGVVRKCVFEAGESPG